MRQRSIVLLCWAFATMAIIIPEMDWEPFIVGGFVILALGD